MLDADPRVQDADSRVFDADPRVLLHFTDVYLPLTDRAHSVCACPIPPQGPRPITDRALHPIPRERGERGEKSSERVQPRL